MKQTHIRLIVTGFIILALLATNPSIEDHREGVKKMYKDKLAELNKNRQDDLATQIGTGIGMLIGDGFIDKIVSRDNYLLFSLTKVPIGQYQTKNIGIGILGQVFVKDYKEVQSEIGRDDFDNQTETINENQNSIPVLDNSNVNKSIINMESIDKKPIINSMSFKKSTINSNTFMYYFERGYEDEGFLYLYNDKSDNLFKVFVSNFDPISFESEHIFDLFEWKYNSNKTECQQLNYEVILKYFDTKPVFDYKIKSKGPCAG